MAEKYAKPIETQKKEKAGKKTRKCELKDSYLNKFLDDNTIGGLSHVFRGESNLRRLVWGFIFIGALFGCITMLTLSAIRFSERPTASTITVISHDEDGTPFPGVTICNLNLERNHSDIVSNRTYQIMNHLFNSDESYELSGYNSISVINICKDIVSRTSSEVQNTTIWSSQKLAQTINNLIHFCGYKDGLNSTLEDCKHQFRPVLTSAGICYTINYGNTHIIKNSGARYGLKLILNINQDTRPSYNGKSGVKVIVHDSRDIARPNLYGINVPPGQAIDIGVARKVSQDNTEEAHCIDGKELSFFKQNRYSQFACRQNAIIEHIAQDSTCGCVIQPNRPFTGPYVNTPNCTARESCCLLEQYSNFDPDAQCPLPCFFSYYDYVTSYADFPNGRYLEDLMEATNKSEQEIRKNYLSITVFFNDLQVTTTITTYTFGVEALLGEIGGQTGLFLGFSIITFFELLILCLDEIKRLCCTREMKKKIEEIDEAIPLPEIREGEEEEEEGEEEEEEGEEEEEEERNESNIEEKKDLSETEV